MTLKTQKTLHIKKRGDNAGYYKITHNRLIGDPAYIYTDNLKSVLKNNAQAIKNWEA